MVSFHHIIIQILMRSVDNEKENEIHRGNDADRRITTDDGLQRHRRIVYVLRYLGRILLPYQGALYGDEESAKLHIASSNQ